LIGQRVRRQNNIAKGETSPVVKSRHRDVFALPPV
jgi:hypothetical protein